VSTTRKSETAPAPAAAASGRGSDGSGGDGGERGSRDDEVAAAGGAHRPAYSDEDLPPPLPPPPEPVSAWSDLPPPLPPPTRRRNGGGYRSSLPPGVEIPPAFVCPITQDLMLYPVVTADGQTYEREAIEEWLRGHDTSPLTGERLAHTGLTPNMMARGLIREWLEKLGLNN